MRDTQLLRAAIDASGYSARRFATAVLDVNERTARRWLSGERTLDSTVRVVCAAIVDDPPLACRLAAALDTLRAVAT
jgi:hypothetical protein